MLAANIVGKTRRGMAASIVDLAVRKKIRIVERQGEGWIKSESFGVQQLDSSGLLQDEQLVMSALFAFFGFNSAVVNVAMGGAVPLPPGIQLTGAVQPTEPSAGVAVRWLTRGDTVLGREVQSITKQVAAEAQATGLRGRRPHGILLLCALLGIGGLVLLLITTTSDDGNGIGATLSTVGLIVGIWVMIGALGLVASIKPLTKAGSKLWDQLEGLKLYIRLAEADRLKMLQSVSGAERIPTSDNTQIVKIYERLLPYAVLFGLEKEWAVAISRYYDTTPHDWYSGPPGLHVAAFAAGVSSFSSTVSTSYSGSSGSSSSGGGGGGGSSGGGGGGGGGGGV